MRLARALAPLCMLAAACNLMFGVSDYEVGPSQASGGAGGDGASEGASTACLANEVEACYEGPEGTLDVGICAAGEAVCRDDGSGFGECENQTQPQMEDCQTLDDEDCNGLECGDPIWSRPITDDNSMERQMVTGVAATDEAVFVSGYYLTSARIGGHAVTAVDLEEGFVAKVSAADGTAQWLVPLRGMLAQTANDIAVDPAGDVIVVGEFSSSIQIGESGPVYNAVGNDDIFVTKLNPNTGGEIWTRTFGGAENDRAHGVAVSPSGHIAVAGDFGGPVDWGPVTLDGTAPFSDLFAFVADSDGAVQWVLQIGGDDSVSGTDVTFIGDTIGVSATFSGVADVRGSPVVAVGQDGLAIIASQGAGALANVDTHHHLPGPGSQTPLAAGSLDGDLLIGGHFGGSIDFGDGARASTGQTDVFIVRYTPAAPTYRIFGNPSTATLGSFDVDTQGEITLVGAFVGTLDVIGHPLGPSGASDIFVAKLDSNLDLRFASFYGDPLDQAATAVAISPDRSILAGGWFFGVLDLGEGTSTAQADDGFIAKLAY